MANCFDAVADGVGVGGPGERPGVGVVVVELFGDGLLQGRDALEHSAADAFLGDLGARCTTCRVEFVAGEPDAMTEAEKQVLAARGLTGVRLSCQIPCDHDMTVRIISRLTGSGRGDAGGRPAETITPEPVWTTKE